MKQGGHTHVAPESVVERVARHRQRRAVLVAKPVERARCRRVVRKGAETHLPLRPFHLCRHPAVQALAPLGSDQARARKEETCAVRPAAATGARPVPRSALAPYAS